MGLFSFLKDAGKKIFGSKEEIKKDNPVADEQVISQTQMQAIRNYVAGLGLSISNFDVQLSGDGELTLSGECASKADYEKVALTAGNIYGIQTVQNNMTVASAAPEAAPEPDALLHTVEKGDSLWKIAEKYYGNGSKYPTIFEANQPMIKDPDEIYPGQVLRVPQG
jgi:nucleoid-associated protein YgaU